MDKDQRNPHLGLPGRLVDCGIESAGGGGAHESRTTTTREIGLSDKGKKIDHGADPVH